MKTGKNLNDEFAQYIVDSVETDGVLYKTVYRPTVKNYAIKKVNGVYDPNLAVKGLLPLVTEGIKKYKPAAEAYYEQQFGIISPAIKQKIAVELLAGMQGEINDLARIMKQLKDAGKPWQQSQNIGNWGGVRFQNPGSALRKSSKSNPRIYECPSCKKPNKLTAKDKAKGYQCDDCADRAEGLGYFGASNVWARKTAGKKTTWINKNNGSKISLEEDKNKGGFPTYSVTKEGGGYSGSTVSGNRSTVMKELKKFMTNWEK